VTVTVLEVDLERKRISLSLKGTQGPVEKRARPPEKRPEKKKEERTRRPERFTNNPFAEALRSKR
jgi:ribosomal protein S1